MALSHSAEILLKGLQSVYSQFKNENGDLISLSSCMPFTTLTYLISSEQSGLLAVAMIKDLDEGFTIQSDPIDDCLLWCQTKQIFPPISKVEYKNNDNNRLKVFQFILQHLRMKRLRAVKHKTPS